jgi:hydrogenase nickel incorporation protein HypB
MHSHERPHEHHHGEELAHQHRASVATLHEPQHGNLLRIEQDVLVRNNRMAERNRGWLEGRGVLALNLLSSPGAGKTTLLEKTIRALHTEIEMCVVEGDQETTLDAERIRAAGCPSVQVNTGTGCHLDAPMLAHALHSLDPPRGSLLLIENVGNLVCPALFDLGEAAKIVILSVTEGDDKPLKYPHMFRAAQLMLVNKTDLLAHVDFDVQACLDHARRVNPEIELLRLSARSGAGLEDWYAWLRARVAAAGLRAGVDRELHTSSSSVPPRRSA